MGDKDYLMTDRQRVAKRNTPGKWPVSDREKIPWWFHALNYGCLALLIFFGVLLVLAAVVGWAAVL